MTARSSGSAVVLLWGDSLTEGRPGVAFAPILAEALPGIAFRNLGRGGDTVTSLLRRLKRSPKHPRAALAVLWVGVNDAMADLVPGYHLYQSAVGRTPQRRDEDFAAAYARTLKALSKRADRVLALPPLFIGEDPRTERNVRLKARGERIRELCAETGLAEFLDIRPYFPLDPLNPPAFLPKNPWAKIIDGFALGDEEAYGRTARRRGLRWTFDGVHLNAEGARTIAGLLAEAVSRRLSGDDRGESPDVRALIDGMGMTPHSEGGWFRESYRSEGSIPAEALPDGAGAPRSYATSICYLLDARSFSSLHRLRFDEIWYFHEGDPLDIETIDPAGRRETLRIGPPSRGFAPQATVPAGRWFGARVAAGGKWTLTGCVVAPGFDYEDYELARRDALTALFPDHAEFIRGLTRD